MAIRIAAATRAHKGDIKTRMTAADTQSRQRFKRRWYKQFLPHNGYTTRGTPGRCAIHRIAGRRRLRLIPGCALVLDGQPSSQSLR